MPLSRAAESSMPAERDCELGSARQLRGYFRTPALRLSDRFTRGTVYRLLVTV